MGIENVDSRRAAGLRWQSQAVLLVFVPVLTTWVLLTAGQAWVDARPLVMQAVGISAGFAALAFALRAATLGAALTGGVFTATLYLATPGWHTMLWPLLALFLLTWGATRFGRKRKEALGTAEGKRGRTASQVAANLGVAAMAAVPAMWGGTEIGQLGRVTLVAALAAMAEATADTVSSELGQVLGGEPVLITSFRRVAAGSDGAVSLMGTLTGCAAAAVVVGAGMLVLPLSRAGAAIALGAAIAGLFVDSLLGAGPERRGWLNNDAVNALSTLAAAALAAVAMGRR